MAIRFTCPHCGHQTDVDDAYAGKSGPCSSCGQTISIPWADQRAARGGPASSKSGSAVLIGVVVAVVLVAGLGIMGVLVALLLPAVGAARNAAQRVQCISNAKRVTLAIDAYHQAHGNYPPAYSVDENGRPLHSWRVLILPYLGPEEAALYERFDLGQPWDSALNQSVARQMPSVYGCPTGQAGSLSETSFCVVQGEGLMFNGAETSSRDDVTDGLSQTLMFVEVVSSSIGWTEPKDIDVTKMAQGINSGVAGCCGSNHNGGAVVAFADGAVHFLPDVTSPEELHDMSTIAGGEIVSP